MKKNVPSILFVISIFCSFFSLGQVGIGTSNPRAALDVVSTTSGFIMPRFADHTTLTSSLGVDQRGMQVYNTTTNTVWCWNGASWSECGTARNFNPFYVELSGSPATAFGSAFTTHVFQTVQTAPAGAYNATTGEITIPSDGIYQLTGSIRVTDGSPVRTQFGFGVHTSNIDGHWFLWHMVQDIASTGRVSYPYMRVGRFNAGDRLRMFVYTQGASLTMQDARLQVIKISN